MAHKASISKKAVYEAYGRGDVETLLAALRCVAEGQASEPLTSPAKIAARYMADMGALEQEELWVVLLNTRNIVIDTAKVYRGSVNSSGVRVGELFREAIRQNAVAVVVMHNHPSGDPSPSPEDVAVTRALIEAGKLLDIEVIDHLVFGLGRYVSLRTAGLAF